MVDAPASGAGVRKDVEVRVLFRVPDIDVTFETISEGRTPYIRGSV